MATLTTRAFPEVDWLQTWAYNDRHSGSRLALLCARSWALGMYLAHRLGIRLPKDNSTKNFSTHETVDVRSSRRAGLDHYSDAQNNSPVRFV